jgi:hypothetical protein
MRIFNGAHIYPNEDLTEHSFWYWMEELHEESLHSSKVTVWYTVSIFGSTHTSLLGCAHGSHQIFSRGGRTAKKCA